MQKFFQQVSNSIHEYSKSYTLQINILIDFLIFNTKIIFHFHIPVTKSSQHSTIYIKFTLLFHLENFLFKVRIHNKKMIALFSHSKPNEKRNILYFKNWVIKGVTKIILFPFFFLFQTNL